ncbi:hypothetical protein HSBAA_PA_0840 (plasmid) [Vreelandella sulfidaeris]|uniref:LysM domain-containing protein n=1 Tax=Vreelandella sulfidaeris TaxID=115553 RepID=A0A455ULA5_9GAMM|nr:hypothetical protein HSBAA_PA_0840 [Halomonas sulfidaeris]
MANADRLHRECDGFVSGMGPCRHGGTTFHCQETEWPKGHYPLPEEGNIIGEADTFTVKDYDDTLIDIAKRHNLGYLEMIRANPEVSIWVPGWARK